MKEADLDDALQRELDAVAGSFTKLTGDVDKLRRRVEQLSALRTAAPAEAAQLHAFERVLDFDRVAQHVRTACAAAELSAGPVPHLMISEVFPGDVYAAIVDAIPEPAFFEAVTDDGYELRVPPRVASFQALVTWEFVTAVVLRVFSAALLARLHEPLVDSRTDAVSCPAPARRLERRGDVFSGPHRQAMPRLRRCLRRGPALGPAHDDRRPRAARRRMAGAGSVLGLPPSSGRIGPADSGPVKNIPFRANGALAFVGPASAHRYASIPHGAPEHAVRHAYEFGVGPTRDGQEHPERHDEHFATGHPTRQVVENQK